MAASSVTKCPRDHTFHFGCILNRIKQDQECPSCENVVEYIVDSHKFRYSAFHIHNFGTCVEVPALSGRSSRQVWLADDDRGVPEAVIPARRAYVAQLSPSSASSSALSSYIQTSSDSDSDDERLPPTLTGSDVPAQAGPDGDGHDSLGASAPDPPSAAESTNNALIEPPSETICVICIEPVHSDAISVTRCGHAFHDECIEQWLHVDPRCPICRGAQHPQVDEDEDVYRASRGGHY